MKNIICEPLLVTGNVRSSITVGTAINPDKLVGYAVRVVVEFVEPYAGKTVTDTIYCEGKSKAAALRAAFVEKAKQLGIDGTVSCKIDSGTFPITRPLRG
jgi:hypothetical protein